ncbi:MAG: hypothetical protein QM667_10680 [Asticcacaulis sp.]
MVKPGLKTYAALGVLMFAGLSVHAQDAETAKIAQWRAELTAAAWTPDKVVELYSDGRLKKMVMGPCAPINTMSLKTVELLYDTPVGGEEAGAVAAYRGGAGMECKAKGTGLIRFRDGGQWLGEVEDHQRTGLGNIRLSVLPHGLGEYRAPDGSVKVGYAKANKANGGSWAFTKVLGETRGATPAPQIASAEPPPAVPPVTAAPQTPPPPAPPPPMVQTAATIQSAPALTTTTLSARATAGVPDEIGALIRLKKTLTASDWKPEARFVVSGPDYQLPGSARKVCVPGKPVNVEIVFVRSDAYRSTPATVDTYRGPSVGCFPAGNGLLVRGAYAGGKPAQEYWVGGVTTPLSAAAQKQDKSYVGGYKILKPVERPLIPVTEGVGLVIPPNAADFTLARRSTGQVTITGSKYGDYVDAYPKTASIGAVYANGIVQINDPELVKKGLTDAMWSGLSAWPYAERAAIFWPDGRVFAGKTLSNYPTTELLVTGDVYMPDGLRFRGQFYSASKSGFMRSKSSRTGSAKPPEYMPGLYIQTPYESALGAPGLYRIRSQPTDTRPFEFTTSADLLTQAAKWSPAPVRRLPEPVLDYADAPEVGADLPPLPLMLEMDELPQIAEASKLYDTLTAPDWRPAHTFRTVEKSNRICGNLRGAARFDLGPQGIANRVQVRVADMACVNGRTKGLLSLANGTVWVGDITVDAQNNAIAVGKGVEYDGRNGNFIVFDRDRSNDSWRAYGDRNGQMIITLETEGLMKLHNFGGDHATGWRTISEGPVLTRLFIPEVGYFDGMSDYENGFIFGGTKATRANPYYGTGKGMRLETEGFFYYTTFYAIDGSYSLTGYLSTRADPFAAHLSVGYGAASEGLRNARLAQNGPWQWRQPVDAGRLTMAGFGDAPIRISTYVDTPLGPPGNYLLKYGTLAPGGPLPSRQMVAPEPDTLARLKDKTGYYAEETRTQAQVDAIFTKFGQETEDYWNRVFKANDAHNKAQYAEYNKERNEQIAYERQQERERQARQANLARELAGAFAYLNQRVEHSAWELRQSARQIDAINAGHNYVPRELSPEEKRQLAQSRAYASRKYADKKGAVSPAAKATDDAAKARLAAQESKLAEAAKAEAKLKAETEAKQKEAETADAEKAATLKAEAEAKEAELAQLQKEREALEQKLKAERDAEEKRLEEVRLAEAAKREEERLAEEKKQEELKLAEARRKQEEAAKREKENRRLSAQASGRYFTTALPEVRKDSGGPGSGTLRASVGNVGRCDATSVTVKYNLGSWGASRNASLSWAGEGDCKPGTWLKVWLRVEAGPAAFGWVEVDVDPVKANSGFGHNMGEIADWNNLLCGFDGIRSTGCMDAESAKRIWTNGRVTDFAVVWAR